MRQHLNAILAEICGYGLSIGDSTLIGLVDQAAGVVSDDPRNLIERMEELAAALERAQEAMPDPGHVLTEIDFAYGIAGEILTMIDGR